MPKIHKIIAAEIICLLYTSSDDVPVCRRVQMIKDLESGRAASPVMAAIKEMKLELSAQDVARIAERVKQIVGGQAGGGGGAAVANLSPAQLARMIDHTILKPEATQDDVKKPVSYTHLDVYKRQPRCPDAPARATRAGWRNRTRGPARDR